MLRTLHKIIGLTLGAIMTVIGLSGSLLVFDHAIDDRITPQLRSLSTSSAAPLQLALSNAIAAAPDNAVATRIDLARGPGAPHMVRFACRPPDDCTIEASIDTASGAVVALRRWGEYPMSWLYRFHYTLLSGDTGKTLVGSMGIILLFFLGSGIYLWWPRKTLRIRAGSSIRLMRELHQVVGVVAVPVLLICALTGITLVFYSQVHTAVDFFAPVAAKPQFHVSPAGQPKTIDELLNSVQTRYPAASVKRIYLPRRASQPLQVRLNTPDEAWSNHGASVAWINPYNGEVMGFWNAGKLPPGNTLLTWVFPLHNADALGFAGRILWVVAGLVPGLLFISGLLFWWLKKRSKAALKAQ